MLYEKGNEPTLRFLTTEDREKIHRAALTILSEIGMFILQDDALAILRNAGCVVGDDNLVRIPETMVLDAIASAPSNIPIYDRNGTHVMDLGGRRTYYGTGSDLIYTVDPDTGERRNSALADVARAARVSDALNNIDFIMSFAHPTDVAPRESYLRSFAAMAAHSVKPIVCTAENAGDLAEMWAIAGILRSGEAGAREKPYFICYDEPISPLKHPRDSLEKLLFCAEKGIPCIYSPAPNSGAAAPVSIAGHVAQALAESLCGLVIHQRKAEGAPFLMGMGAAVLDMITGNSCYNAPESIMAYIAMCEMHIHYDLPNWGYGATSDAHEPDWQAGFEAGLMTFFSDMSGSNLCHDVGYLDFGLTGNLVELVICDEMIDQVRRLRRGIPVNDETLGLEAIRDVGVKRGDFLAHPHTFRHARATQWRPKLFNRIGHDKWVQQGRPSIAERAKARLKEILETHTPSPIPEALQQAIDRRIAAFTK